MSTTRHEAVNSKAKRVVAGPRITHAVVAAASYSDWLDKELSKLEDHFDSFVTLHSSATPTWR